MRIQIHTSVKPLVLKTVKQNRLVSNIGKGREGKPDWKIPSDRLVFVTNVLVMRENTRRWAMMNECFNLNK